MAKEIIRTQHEIDEVLDACVEYIEKGESHFPSMPYEEGVQAMYDWLVGNVEESPME